MTTGKARSDWHVEYDDDFARWYRQQSFKPFLAIFFSVLSFIVSGAIDGASFGNLIGFLLVTYAFGSHFWRDYKLKESYECKACAKKLRFSECDDENEIRYFCFDCCIEYRVRTDGRYGIE